MYDLNKPWWQQKLDEKDQEIRNLNARIVILSTENAALKQQLAYYQPPPNHLQIFAQHGCGQLDHFKRPTLIRFRTQREGTSSSQKEKNNRINYPDPREANAHATGQIPTITCP